MTKPLALLVLGALSAVAGAQAWIRPYDAGLAAARAGKWAEAREAFQQAIAIRPEDQSGPTVLPGPATERKLWREGKPYSPNFLAAYALYRQSLLAGDPMDSAKLMRDAAGEFETLVNKNQASPETFFFLDVIYTKLGDATKRQVADDKRTKLGNKASFKVDAEPVAPEEVAALQARTSGGTGAVVDPNVPGGRVTTVTPGAPFGAGPSVRVGGSVAPLADKFALVIGQSETRIGGMLPYAANDAQRVRDALVSFAGYPAENVQMLQNATAAQIKAAAEALAAKVADGGTVAIFFAGAGVNLSGKDYLAGSDTSSPSDTASMIGKAELFRPFVQKGARVFSFFETNRPIDANGAYFGAERIEVGSTAQFFGTRAGDTVTPTYRDNQQVGLFANAVVTSLGNLRANRIPITEFGWMVYYAMRRGDTGIYGGGGTQVCTLPILTSLASDARF